MKSISPWLFIAFLAGFLAVGLPYWQIPHNKVNLPSALLGFGLIVVAAAALISCLIGKTPLLRTIVIVGASVPAVVMARVMFDTMKDPTSHNLWPLEVMIALALGVGASVTGVLIGSLLLRARRAAEKRDE